MHVFSFILAVHQIWTISPQKKCETNWEKQNILCQVQFQNRLMRRNAVEMLQEIGIFFLWKRWEMILLICLHFKEEKNCVHKYLFFFSYIFFLVWQFFVVRNSDINDVQQKLNRLAEMFVKYRNIIFFCVFFSEMFELLKKRFRVNNLVWDQIHCNGPREWMSMSSKHDCAYWICVIICAYLLYFVPTPPRFSDKTFCQTVSCITVENI